MTLVFTSEFRDWAKMFLWKKVTSQSSEADVSGKPQEVTG